MTWNNKGTFTEEQLNSEKLHYLRHLWLTNGIGSLQESFHFKANNNKSKKETNKNVKADKNRVCIIASLARIQSSVNSHTLLLGGQAAKLNVQITLKNN